MELFIDVALNRPLHRLLTYRLRLADGQTAHIGQRVRVPVRSSSVVGFIIHINTEVPADNLTDKLTIKDAIALIDSDVFITEELLQLATWMSDYYLCSLGQALATIAPTVTKKTIAPILEIDTAFAEPATLSSQQQDIVRQFFTSKKRYRYLYGVTGSGKSEVILEITKQIVNNGGGVMILVPEIALALQSAESFAQRINVPFAILHSKLTNSQRTKQLKDMLQGKARVVIGARSAVFAPIANLQLIIMDEEQENAYKSDNTPRYHARHVAFKRAQMNGCDILFVSATPSLESWHAMTTEKYHVLTLQERYAGSLPSIHIISMVGMKHMISPPLEHEILTTLQSGQQVMLLHNRRGFGLTLVCNRCGTPQTCSRCAISLVYHQHSNEMRCHYCGEVQTKHVACPQCSSIDLSFAGYGIERVESEIRQLFAQYSMVRIDTDSMKNHSILADTMQKIKNNKVQIIIGTQMVAKGLNFNNVQLVGIISADASLCIPDFRAAERTHALITQVAGRAGRHKSGAKVIVQTYQTDSQAIVSSATYNHQSFYKHELTVRQACGFPPYTRMIRVIIRGADQQKVQSAINDFAEQCHRHNTYNSTIYGPTECAIAKIKHNYRFQILLLDKSMAPIRSIVSQAIHQCPTPPKLFLEIDIDPSVIL